MGHGDTTQSIGWENIGFAVRAMAATPSIRVAVDSDTFSGWVGTGNHDYRLKPITDTLAGCSHVLCAYGTNDVAAGAALGTIQANAIAAWQLFDDARLQVFQTTITPTTTSTDSWATTANQTISGSNAVRVSFNDWLRDGAPISSAFVAVATGSGGSALRAGDPLHPLAGYFETADSVESGRNSGKWAASKTADGIHPNAAGHLLMAAAILTASFVFSSRRIPVGGLARPRAHAHRGR
jgi:lysophospholipase L1-like esterase